MLLVVLTSLNFPVVGCGSLCSTLTMAASEEAGYVHQAIAASFIQVRCRWVAKARAMGLVPCEEDETLAPATGTG